MRLLCGYTGLFGDCAKTSYPHKSLMLSAKEPCVSAKEPCVSAKELYIDAKVFGDCAKTSSKKIIVFGGTY